MTGWLCHCPGTQGPMLLVGVRPLWPSFFLSVVFLCYRVEFCQVDPVLMAHGSFPKIIFFILGFQLGAFLCLSPPTFWFAMFHTLIVV